jgi:hypothetical protein
MAAHSVLQYLLFSVAMQLQGGCSHFLFFAMGFSGFPQVLMLA